MEMEQDIIYICENNSDKEFLCQYIINAGSNNDPVKKNGLSHLAEHFLIHLFNKSNLSKTVIHGFTGFYYTNYYWYANNIVEAKKSFEAFDTVIRKGKEVPRDEKLFIDTKREIEEEIIFYAKKNDNLAKIISTLADDNKNIALPIGSVEDVRNIRFDDLISYLHEHYISTNVHKFLLDKNNEIINLTRVGVHCVQNKLVTTSTHTFNELDRQTLETRPIYCAMDKNTIKIIFKDIFTDSLEEIILGEIFMMQTCEFVNKTMMSEVSITYEIIFVSKNEIYYALTLDNMELNDYFHILETKEIPIYKTLSVLLNKDGFNKYSSDISHYLLEHNRAKVQKREIMIDLINYVTLSFDSYNIIKNKEKLISFIDELNYEKYHRLITEKILNNINENVKILY